ncbi:MAG: proton-conducting transporter membrane subunit [Planctomycetota bacterium]
MFIFQIAGIIVVIAPLALVGVMGVTTLLRVPLSERTMARLTEASTVFGLVSALLILAIMLATGRRYIPVEVGDWVSLTSADGILSENPASAKMLEDSVTEPLSVPSAGANHSAPEHQINAGKAPLDERQASRDTHSEHFHFTMKFVFDRLSVPFVIMTFVLCGVIAAFASRYLHRDEGFHRFFVFFSFFQLGMILSSVAGTIETLFFGWELVGLSSALLVAFFHDRPAPVSNGLRVWTIYRVADAAFLVAALTLHHLSGSGDFGGIAGQSVAAHSGADEVAWPMGKASISEGDALLVGCLLLFAAAGKSGLIPFSGWLPRAMEGPTPSSAVFYGALSVHLGAFLLLRVSPLLDESQTLQILVVVLGAATAVFATMAARVQTDIKSSLAFSSLIQVSIIVVEIGLGLRYIALIHIIGHACLRTLQLIRAPSLLRDYNTMINAIGDYLPSGRVPGGPSSPTFRSRLYQFAFDRGNLDTMIDDYVVRPFVAVFSWSDRMERKWTEFLNGNRSRNGREDH